MVIGKTSPTISLSDIFSRFTEAEVLNAVFPQITSLPFSMCSPFRTDKHPSFYIYMSDGGHIYYKDFGDSSDKGSLMDLLCKYWNCTFNQSLAKIGSLLISGKDVTIKPRQIKTLTRRESDQLSKIEIKIRPWKEYDFEYWSSYGIDKKWLKYAEIYPISHKIVTKKESPTDKGKKYIFTADKYAYCYLERKDNVPSLKIYQPFNKDGYKWCSKMDSSVIGLWTKIPEYGDRVVICSSLKDALCLACQCHIPTLCLQGEGYSMSDTAINELKRRYNKVFICFDTDKPGRKDAEKLAKETGFVNVVPDLGKEKDLSDFYKSLEDKQQFKQLELLFH